MLKNLKLRLLMIEDSPDDVKLVIYELRRAGFDIEWKCVQTAQELRSTLAESTWDICLADYTMPQFTAIEALALIQEVSPDLPCIIVSGTIGEDKAVEAMRAGAQDFFVKGHLARLPEAIKRQLFESENVRERKQTEQELRISEANLAAEREEALAQEKAARERIESLYHEAQEANRLKEDFLTTLSHELRTPMNAITGWAELLVKGECDERELPLAYAAIYRNAIAQNKLIDDLLDISRIISGKLVIENQSVELDKVVAGAIDSIRLSAQVKNIKFQIDIDPSLGPVAGDPTRLQQVIWNLLSNAVKFTPRGGSIQITLRRDGLQAELTVSDTGEGIDPGFLPHMFERFRQADSGLKRVHGGLGLGLSIVRQLVELHGGQVSATSEGIGKGSTFKVRLPLSAVRLHGRSDGDEFQSAEARQKIASALNARPKENRLLSGIKALLVDDQVDSLNLLGFVLRRQGAEVRSATSGDEGLRLFQQSHPDVILSDIEMPGQNGYEFIGNIRREEGEKRTPAAALTAHVRSEDVARALAAGFDLHLQKPFDAKNIVQSVAKLARK